MQRSPSLAKGDVSADYRKGNFEHPPKWAEYVAKKLPRDKVRVRRDWDRFLNFCSAVALWRSFGKKQSVDISFKDYCIAYRIFDPVFASTLHSRGAQEDLISAAVAKLYKRSRRAVTTEEIADELGWEKVVYKHLKNAVRHRLVKYEHGTHEHNVKPVLPIDRGGSRFLPSPRSVLKHLNTDRNDLGDRLLTIREVSTLTGLRVSSLYHVVSQGRIPVVRLSKRCIRFRYSDLLEWIETHTEKAHET